MCSGTLPDQHTSHASSKTPVQARSVTRQQKLGGLRTTTCWCTARKDAVIQHRTRLTCTKRRPCRSASAFADGASTGVGSCTTIRSGAGTHGSGCACCGRDCTQQDKRLMQHTHGGSQILESASTRWYWQLHLDAQRRRHPWVRRLLHPGVHWRHPSFFERKHRSSGVDKTDLILYAACSSDIQSQNVFRSANDRPQQV